MNHAERSNWDTWTPVLLNDACNTILWRSTDDVKAYILTEHYRTGPVISPTKLTFFAHPGNGKKMRAQQAEASKFFALFHGLEGEQHEPCRRPSKEA
ncbi:MAG TPA: hypothetical protein VLG40_05340 [Candidatus Saccharimonas sp.]|nr:hypothetical protein [Candidatus Saccharimonas sp.]